MGVSGNLKSMLPGDVLQWLSLGQKTGTLSISNKAVEKRIFFRAGRIISSASNDPREYLGQFLMSHGFLTEPELMKAMEVQQQSGILLGKILVMIEAIEEEDLQRLMRMKAEEQIYDIFLWPEGEFLFTDDELPTQQMIPLQLDVTGIIMEGTRRVDEWPRIREVIPNDNVVPVIAKKIDTKELDDVQRTIVGAINAKRTIAEIVLESRSSPFTVSSAIHNLIRGGFVRVAESAPRKPSALTQEMAPVVLDDAAEVANLIQRAQDALRKKEYEKTQRLLKAAENLGPTEPKVRSAIKGAEAVIVSDLRGQGLREDRVPRVAKPLEEITKMDFTPNEGFILSRVNGQWDIGALLKISPIREPDALLIFYKLWKDGIIELGS